MTTLRLPAALPSSFATATALNAGLSRVDLRHFIAAGVIEPFARGLYRRVDAALTDLDLVEIAIRAPEATLCLMSALAAHELTDLIPLRIDAALPRTMRAPRVRAPVTWHRFDPRTFHVGREQVELEPGLTIGRYTPERTLVDLFRLKHQEGSDLAHEALRRWLRAPTSTPAALLDLARRIPRAEAPLRNALEVLL